MTSTRSSPQAAFNNAQTKQSNPKSPAWLPWPSTFSAPNQTCTPSLLLPGSGAVVPILTFGSTLFQMITASSLTRL